MVVPAEEVPVASFPVVPEVVPEVLPVASCPVLLVEGHPASVEETVVDQQDPLEETFARPPLNQQTLIIASFLPVLKSSLHQHPPSLVL